MRLALPARYLHRFSPLRRVDGETGEFHGGIDIANASDTLINVTADGTVVRGPATNPQPAYEVRTAGGQLEARRRAEP